MSDFSDAAIVESWRKNALPWTSAVRLEQIESRKLATDAAIVAAILGRSPRSVLDVGCGEGWLARALCAHSITVVGIDVVPALIENARALGGGEFRVTSYEDLAAGAFAATVDVVVCNFALLGNESVEGVFAAVGRLLNPGGAFIVQTLHPEVANGEAPYEDGWRAGSWDGFAPDFSDPAPWYFRTLDSWRRLFAKHRLRLLETREPTHPATQRPASVIFVAEVDEPRVPAEIRASGFESG